MSIPSDSFSSSEEQEPIERADQEQSTPPTIEQEQQTGEGEAGEETVNYPHSTLPQEARGEANGGPLGCCLGSVVGLLFTLLVIVGISVSLSNGGFLGGATLPVALLGGVIGGYFGWRLGKKLYREYEPPVVKSKRARKKRPEVRRTLR